MINLYSALTSVNSDQEGIQSLKVFYDTLQINVKKTIQFDTYDFVLLEKLNFDYDTNSFDANGKSFAINFGQVGIPMPNSTFFSGYCDTVFLEKEKALFICGLSSIRTNYCIPIIYRYDINNSVLEKKYPLTPEDEDNWSSFLVGLNSKYTIPLITYNFDQDVLSYVFTSLTYPDFNIGVYKLNFVDFRNVSNNLNLSNVISLSSVYTPATTDDEELVLVKYMYDENRTVLLRRRDTIFPLVIKNEINEDTDEEPHYYFSSLSLGEPMMIQSLPNFKTKVEEKGVVFCASPKYHYLMHRAVASLRQSNPDIPYYCHEAEDDLLSRESKLSVNEWTPFEKTLFIDCDTMITESLDDIWQLLDEYPLWMAPQTVSSRTVKDLFKPGWLKEMVGMEYYNNIFKHIRPEQPYYNSGVILFRKSEVSEFFTRWKENWISLGKKTLDQIPLAQTIFEMEFEPNSLPLYYHHQIYISKKNKVDKIPIEFPKAAIYHFMGDEKDYSFKYWRRVLNSSNE